jgi:hypothetical protein
MPEHTWKPSARIDRGVRAWMKANGLKVNSTRYYDQEEVYAWRHQRPAGSPTLWMARPVLEDRAPEELVAGLERLGVADRMRQAPMARFLVVDEGGELQVTPWSHRPHRGA